MRSIVLVTIFACGNMFSFAQSIESQVKNFLKLKELKTAQVGFSMTDLSSGKNIYHYRGDKSMMTASTLKLITTASALEILGPDHIFETKLLLDGSVEDGVLIGNIIIRGEGDPSLASQHFLKHYDDVVSTWTRAIQEYGITEIKGKIIGDNSYFSGISLVGSTAVKDIGNYYGAGAHALSAYENTYSLYLKSPNKTDSDVTIVRTIPPNVLDLYTFVNEVQSSTINKDYAYIYGIPDSDLQIAKGTIPMNKSSFKIKGSIPNPAMLLAHQLTQNLLELEIPVSEKPSYYATNNIPAKYNPENLKNITTIISPPLSEIVAYTNLKSINTFANNLIKNIGKTNSKNGTYKNGIETIITYWQNKGINTEGWFQEDGSGLSRANAISANQLTEVISKTSLKNREILKIGLKDFAKSKRRIITKSGYMNRVRSFAGYMTLKDGREVAFSIIANNYNCSPSTMRKKIEALMLGM